MPEAEPLPPIPSLPSLAAKLGADVGRAVVVDLAAGARVDRVGAWRWGAVVVIFGMAFTLTYLLVKDARDGHAMTQEEYESANRKRDAALAEDNKSRDEKLAAVRQDFRDMTMKLTQALDGVAALKGAQDQTGKDVRDSESRLRTEIQGVNGRVDRVIEILNRPK